MTERTTTQTEKVVATPEAAPPWVMLYGEAPTYECEFCKRKFYVMYLYTRKQIYVCSICHKSVQAIMETNHKKVTVSSSNDQDKRSA